jgi:raffinose/stachyose/melibiose transport system substrate-binding protein
MLTFLISFSAGCLPNSYKSLESSDTSDHEETIVLAHNQNRRVLFETIRNSADRFEADNPGYKVEIEVYVNEAYKKKLASAAATGNLPDVFATWSGSTLNEFSRLNMVIDLTELTQQYNDKERFIPSSLAQASDGNGIWGIPVENITAALMFYNTEKFDEIDLSQPPDWE